MASLTKICGISTADALEAAIAGGASHIGLVHYAPSPRHVTLDAAARLRAQAAGRAQVVLLLVNPQPREVVSAYEAVSPDVLQFHGTETPDYMAKLKAHSPAQIWKAFGVRDASSLERARAYTGAVHRMLYDAPAQALPGGTGTRFDWSLLASHNHAVPWGLAGGLDPNSVADAIRVTGAPLVDVSSGVESAPGIKDVDKIAAFLKAAQTA